MTLIPVVFFDRDGVLVKDGHYLFDASKIEMIPGSAHAIAELRKAGFVVICVTNQSGVAQQKPGASIRSVDECNRRMQELLYHENPQGSFLDIRYSPHGHDDQKFRKPATGLMDPIMPWIDLQHSFFVGDKAVDLECGVNLGLPKAHCMRVKTGKPMAVPGYPEFLDITEATKEILKIFKAL